MDIKPAAPSYDYYYWSTPNGVKVAIMLLECKLHFRAIPTDITKGEQFQPEFLAINPNNKIPALVDYQAQAGPLSLFESGAILQYLGEKTGKFWPQALHPKYEVTKWLMWQVAGLGPMCGQAHHFRIYADEKIPYAIDRYTKEVTRLYKVLDRQLSHHEYVAGAYSIADMACWPWIVPYKQQGQDLEQFPHLKRWFELIGSRDAVKQALQNTMQRTL